MRHRNQTLRLMAAGWMVLGLTAVQATAQTPAGAETWASVAAGLEEERGNEELQRVPPFKVFETSITWASATREAGCSPPTTG